MLEKIGIKCCELIIEEIENEDFRNTKKEPYRIMCEITHRDSVV